jgi:hypothetical protein
MIYDENSTDIHEVHIAFNNLAPTIKFTIETKTDNNINFLDITIQNKENKLLFSVHCKPTTTDVIIPKNSCHPPPPEQKYAAIRHMVNRINSYRLNDYNKQTEQQVIEQIVVSNGYDTSIVKHFNKPGQKGNNNNNKEFWAKFTYFEKETRAITKLFKKTQLRIAFKVNSTINKRLAPKPRNTNPQQQFERSGAYCLTCPDCHMKYVGQTSRSLHKRYKEHLQDFKYNIRKSSFATHLLDNNHSTGPIYEIMDIVYTAGKGKFMDTVERFHIYSETRKNNQINRNTVKPNAIFDVINSHDPLRAHTDYLCLRPMPYTVTTNCSDHFAQHHYYVSTMPDLYISL